MSLQKQVNIYYEKGKAGMKASENPVAFYPRTTLANKDGVVIGHFCWLSNEADLVQETKNGENKPLGFVYGSNRYTLEIDENATTVIKEGYSVDVAQKGDFYAVSDQMVTAGMKVFASNTDGSIRGGQAGNDIPEYTETEFTILNNAEAGEVFIIQRL